jgi:hypothetical protein
MPASRVPSVTSAQSSAIFVPSTSTYRPDDCMNRSAGDVVLSEIHARNELESPAFAASFRQISSASATPLNAAVCWLPVTNTMHGPPLPRTAPTHRPARHTNPSEQHSCPHVAVFGGHWQDLRPRLPPHDPEQHWLSAVQVTSAPRQATASTASRQPDDSGGKPTDHPTPALLPSQRSRKPVEA